jgi:hypothetical protein
MLQETDSSLIGTPIHLTVNRAGAMFISDGMNGRVVEFARDGRFVRRFGARGNGPGEFRTPLASALMGDTILAVADAGSSRTSLFDTRTGAFLRSARHEGFPFSMQTSGDSVWIAAVYQHRNTSLGLWPTARDTFQYLGPFPAEYLESPLLKEWEPYATLLRLDDRFLLGFTGHPALFLTRLDGTVVVTVEIPVARRRGVPHDQTERHKSDPKVEEVAAMQSALVALHQQSSKEIAVVYSDITWQGRTITANPYISLISPDFSKACVDLPLATTKDGAPQFAFRGDTLVLLEQRVTGGAKAVTVARSYLIDAAGCDWVPVAAPGTRVAEAQP